MLTKLARASTIQGVVKLNHWYPEFHSNTDWNFLWISFQSFNHCTWIMRYITDASIYKFRPSKARGNMWFAMNGIKENISSFSRTWRKVESLTFVFASSELLWSKWNLHSKRNGQLGFCQDDNSITKCILIK